MIYSVSSYLRISAERYANSIAVSDGKNSLSYCDLLVNAEKIADVFVKKNTFKKPIAVMIEKSPASIAAFMGIAMSGNYYSVIDEKMPQNRIEKILETLKPEFIISNNRNRKKAESLGVETEKILYYEDLVANEISAEEKVAVENAENRIIDTDILYVLFTSGSTGVPKGVIITHRSVIDYTEWASETFGFNHETVFGNQAPLYFDNSVLDIYSTIRNGASLYLIPQMCFSFPIRLLEFVRDNKINTIFWVPTVLSRVADLNILDKCDVDCLKNVLFAGEVMPARQLNVWRKRLPNALFANLYGPTEITVDCTYYIVNRDIRDDESVPIGCPCRNTDILVLNNDNQLVGIGEKGELCVRGSSLALGYYDNPEKTDAAFVQNPLNSLYRELIYRTGDIVHYNELHEIIYDGRKDSQVKHTGHRIELGEIETAVSSNKDILNNCCIHNSQKDILVLFYVGNTEESSIRKHLSALLPDYMLPNVFIKLPCMPLNMNGKIDRVKLQEEALKL